MASFALGYASDMNFDWEIKSNQAIGARKFLPYCTVTH